mmetsp:Transcript_7007/g.10329  ORF Transcript_7007/g.10329 Transcript_7007/m.10329 type:complete len:321 (-) Transcript_7007:6-968(-)
MCSPSTVGINDNLTSGKAGISLGSSNNELSRGVQVNMTVITAVDGKSSLSVLKGDRFQSLDNDVIMDKIIHFSHGGSNLFITSVGGTVVLSILLGSALGLSGLSMLSGDKHGVDLGGDNRSIGKLIISDGDLGLSIGTEPPERSILTNIGKLLSKLVGKEMGQGHAALSLIRGISKHNTLVTSTNVHIVLTNVDSSSNIGRLLVNAHKNLAVITRETLGLNRGKIINEGAESNLTHLVADNLLVVEVGSGRDLSENHNHVVLGGSLASNLTQGIGLEASIKDGVRDLIAKLIGVALIDRLRGEKECTCFNHVGKFGSVKG